MWHYTCFVWAVLGPSAKKQTIITARGTTPAGLQSAYELSFEAVSFITHHQSILAAGFAGVVSTGAATFCFIKALERRGLKLSYEQLLVEMNYSCKEERECWRCWTGCWEGCACGAPRLLLVLHFLHFALLPQLKLASAVAVINCSRACCRWFNSYLLPLHCSAVVKLYKARGEEGEPQEVTMSASWQFDLDAPFAL